MELLCKDLYTISTLYQEIANYLRHLLLKLLYKISLVLNFG